MGAQTKAGGRLMPRQRFVYLCRTGGNGVGDPAQWLGARAALAGPPLDSQHPFTRCANYAYKFYVSGTFSIQCQ